MKAKKYNIVLDKFFMIVSDDKINKGDWFCFKDGFLDGTVKTKNDYNQSVWNIKRCDSENETASLHRAQFGKNAANGIAGCHKIISQFKTRAKTTDLRLNDLVVPKIKENVIIEM